jgi:hypothetical protein
MTNNESKFFSGGKLRCHYQIAFILTIFIVDHHNHLTTRNSGNDLLRIGEIGVVMRLVG